MLDDLAPINQSYTMSKEAHQGESHSI
jgi:hypothetical protein